MSSWNVTYSDDSTQTLEASDLNSASSLAYGEVPDGLSVISVALQPIPDPILAAGIAKLVSLGLTQDEAVAIASPSTTT